MSSNPTWERIQGKWHQAAGSVKQQWGKLTDNDVAQVNGEREQLAGRIQERYGYTREEARKQVDHWADSIKDHL